MARSGDEDNTKQPNNVIDFSVASGARKMKAQGDLGMSVAFIEQTFPKLRLNLLTGIADNGPSVAEARLFIEEAIGKTLRRDIIADALEIVAKRREYDPLREHIESLPIWDGKCRIGEPGVADAKSWLTTYANADDSDYVRAIGKKYLVGAIARALRPGCKMDCILALVGEQGAKKSSLFEVLGGPFYKSNLNVSDLHGKEARQEIRGSWIVEFPELSTLRKSDFETAKGFLSECTDKYRPSYGRHLISVERRSVFGGTINKNKPFIPDTETQRRLWVVEAGRVLLSDFAKDRSQILAEARVLFEKGETWWFDDSTDEAFAEHMKQSQLPHRFVDPWGPIIADYIAKNVTGNATYVSAILAGIGLNISVIDRRSEMRCAEILRQLGWTKKKQQKIDGVRAVWWLRPGTPETDECYTSEGGVS